MANIPAYEVMLKSALEYTSDKQEHSFRETIEYLAQKYNLSESDRKELLPSGQMAIFDNRVSWTLFYLRKAGLLEGTRRGYNRITQEGLQVIEKNPVVIDVKYLKQFPKFQEFLKPKDKEEEEITIAPSQ